MKSPERTVKITYFENHKKNNADTSFLNSDIKRIGFVDLYVHMELQNAFGSESIKSVQRKNAPKYFKILIYI